jgi:hypothetical protein
MSQEAASNIRASSKEETNETREMLTKLARGLKVISENEEWLNGERFEPKLKA